MTAPLVWLPSAFGEAQRPLPVHDRLVELGPMLVPVGDDSKSMAEHVLWLSDSLETNGFERAVVVGTSFGGWVAAELASWFPERVEALVLVDAMGLYVPGHPAAELFALTLRRLGELLFHDPAAVDTSAMPVFDREVDAMARHLRLIEAEEQMTRLGWSPYLHDRDLPERLGRYGGPALVVWGDDDRVLPRAHAAAWAELVGAEVEIVADAGHLPHIEQPDRVAAVVGDWLSSIRTV
jgi:pimeloyl-ACP methyl ester carboxylesterase